MRTDAIKFYKTVVSLPEILEPNTMYAVRVGAGFDFYLSDMTGSIAYKLNSAETGPTDNNVTIQVDGQSDVVSDNIKFVAGPGLFIETDSTADPKSITFSATATAGSTSPIKTFNILNSFSAPFIGTAVFAPATADVIRTVQLTNGKPVGSDLMVGLYRNNELLSFFTIPASKYTFKYTNLNYVINTNDYLTVNVVSGAGENFSIGLFNYNS